MQTQDTVEIHEGLLSTTLTHEGHGWRYAVSIQGVVWATGWVRGTRQIAYRLAVKSAIEASEVK